jgi:hypothetical protein
VSGVLGNAPWTGSHHTIDSTTPPLVQFHWNGTVDSESRFSGIRSDRYAELARAVADQFAQGISNQVETLAAKFPPLPELPGNLFGPYEPIADFDCLREVNARRACSYSGLLTRNETFWTFPAPGDPVPQLNRIISQLESAGWKVDKASLTNAPEHFVRCDQAGETLELFRTRRVNMGFSESHNDGALEPFIVHYRKPFTDAEREAAMEQLFALPRALETILAFRNCLTEPQRKRFFAMAEESSVPSPAVLLQGAESLMQRGETNAALNRMLRAKALFSVLDDPSEPKSKLDSLAKKIAQGENLKLEVTPEICRELGFLDLTNPPQTFQVERSLGEPLLMFVRGDRGVKILGLRIRPPRGGVYPWALTESQDGMRSRSSSSFSLSTQQEWRHTVTIDEITVEFAVAPNAGENQVKYTVRTKR